MAVRLHEDRSLFSEVVSFTAAETTFPLRLVEKDYFCSVLLEYFGTVNGLVFKGGTCLAKVYANFYRLSEDLDFVFPMAVSSKKKERSRTVKPAKDAFENVTSTLPVIRIIEPIEGANESRQYIGVLGYDSLLSGEVETIKIEIGLREPLVERVETAAVRTLLINPATVKDMVPPLHVRTISRREAIAEKFRAALTRRDVAIRDFFDVEYAVRHLGLNPEAPELVELVRQKIAVPGNDAVNTSNDRLNALRPQVEAELKPVLRAQDYNQFDLNRAFKLVKDMSEHLNG